MTWIMDSMEVCYLAKYQIDRIKLKNRGRK